jgi:hypothetical protein
MELCGTFNSVTPIQMPCINYECAKVSMVTRKLDIINVLNNLVKKQTTVKKIVQVRQKLQMKRLTKFLPLKWMMMIMMTLHFVMTMKLIRDMCRLQWHR